MTVILTPEQVQSLDHILTYLYDADEETNFEECKQYADFDPETHVFTHMERLRKCITT